MFEFHWRELTAHSLLQPFTLGKANCVVLPGEGELAVALGLTLDTHANVAGASRADKRHRLHLDVTGKTDSLKDFDGILRDLSRTGFLLETNLPLATSDELEIALPQAGKRTATVAWLSGCFHGCRFNQPITRAAVSAALLRAPSARHPNSPVADDDGKKSFGTRLKLLRQHLSISQTAFARALGVSKPTVWKWETDATFPRSRRLEKIAELLGMSVLELERGAMPSADQPERVGPSTSDRNLGEVVQSCKSRIAQCAGVRERHIDIVIRL